MRVCASESVEQFLVVLVGFGTLVIKDHAGEDEHDKGHGADKLMQD